MNKKKLLSSVFSRLGLFPLWRVLSDRPPALKILAYHRVMNIDSDNYLFDQHLVDASIEDFDRQMRYLADHYQVMPLIEAIGAFEKGKQENIVALTFDDGFDDLYFNVFPILVKYNIKPTIFITTGLIGTKDTLWSERVVHALKSSIGQSLQLPIINGGEKLVIERESVDEIIKELLRALKQADNLERLRLVAEVLRSLEIDASQHFEGSRMMSWEMVKEMSDWGVEFGSHSVSHPILSKLSGEDLKIELVDSKAMIEERLGNSCETIAYPVGGVGAFNADVKQAVREAGYSAACSYVSGIVSSVDGDVYELKRIHVDSSVSFDWFKGLVSCPELFVANFQGD
jgi:peptidoglycan/xylan/chitin deacetylase (PgdA/CDA1 family)